LGGGRSRLAETFSELGERWQWLQCLWCCNEFRHGFALASDDDFLTGLGSVDESWQFLARLLDSDVLHTTISL
jgi:hypothetical protein